MRRLNRAIALAILALLVTWTAPALAQPRPPRDDGPPAPLIAEHADELGLDEDTRDQIETTVERSRRESQRLRRAHRQTGRSLHELLELDEPDREAVMRQAEVMGEIETERRKLRLGAMLEIRELLSPEQREQLVEMRERDRPQRPDRHARRERMRACEPDVQLFCEGSRHPRAIFRCLEAERDSLSPECGQAFDVLQADMAERRDQRRPFRDDDP